MQLTSARQLYSTLQTSQGPFIEKDKLSAIVKRFQEYQNQVQWQFRQEVSNEVHTRHDVHHGVRDESEKNHDEL